MVAHHVAVWQCQIILVELLSHLWRRGRHVCGDVVDETCSHCARKTVELIETIIYNAPNPKGCEYDRFKPAAARVQSAARTPQRAAL